MKKRLQQLSVFLENKIGNLSEIMEVLGRGDIRVIASMVADTSEFGILRMVTSDNARAYELLREAQKIVNVSEVIAIYCDSAASSLHQQIQKLYDEGVVIEYMYCYSVGDRTVMVLRVDDIDKTLDVATSKGIEVLSNEELVAL